MTRFTYKQGINELLNGTHNQPPHERDIEHILTDDALPGMAEVGSFGHRWKTALNQLLVKQELSYRGKKRAFVLEQREGKYYFTLNMPLDEKGCMQDPTFLERLERSGLDYSITTKTVERQELPLIEGEPDVAIKQQRSVIIDPRQKDFTKTLAAALVEDRVAAQTTQETGDAAKAEIKRRVSQEVDVLLWGKMNEIRKGG